MLKRDSLIYILYKYINLLKYERDGLTWDKEYYIDEIVIFAKESLKRMYIIMYTRSKLILQQDSLVLLNIHDIVLLSFQFRTPAGNQGGYNYQSGGGQYNNGNNYNYQYGSNSIDSYNNFGSRNTYSGIPSPTYGPAFR